MSLKNLAGLAGGLLLIGLARAHPQLEDRPADPATFARAEALCADSIRQQLREPASARLGHFVRVGLRHAASSDLVLRDYRVLVKAKQGLGGYIVDRPWGCSLNEQETRVLWVGALG
ncbi:MAG: hypothetical protein JOY84_20130 [Curvibacter sp.]|nr:hypothetical protein [Curvibacter sp.]